MASFIIRLDDACPNMNHENWKRMLALLDRYHVKPIIGVIPENEDSLFRWEADPNFWHTVRTWQEKGYTIAVHGLHHTYHKFVRGGGIKCYQLSHRNTTEFVGVPFGEQKRMIEEALNQFEAEGVKPRCFFAPGHSYDANTVQALVETGQIEFISDGYALRPYRKSGMVFLPSICDTPFRFPYGTFTFVFHPSFMNEAGFSRLELFLKKEYQSFIPAEEALHSVRSRQGILGKMIERIIYSLRGIRDRLKPN